MRKRYIVWGLIAFTIASFYINRNVYYVGKWDKYVIVENKNRYQHDTVTVFLSDSRWSYGNPSQRSLTARLPLTLQLSYCHQHQSKDMAEYMQSQYALEYLRHKLTARLDMPIHRRLHLTVGARCRLAL